MKTTNEYDKFSSAMDTILKAKPAVVKAAMEAEKLTRAKARRAKRTATGKARKVAK